VLESNKASVVPLFFGESGASAFGILHQPRSSADRGSAVIVCPSIGFEQERCSRSIASLARTLAGAGHHVLRFDYPGTGNSPGRIGPGQLLRWLRATDAAIREIRNFSGTARITIIGLRVGALIAATALATREELVDRLILWDPVVSGREYLTSLRREHREILGHRGQEVGSGEYLLGHPFPRDLVQALEFLDLRANWQWRGLSDATVVLSSGDSRPLQYPQFLRNLKKSAVGRSQGDWSALGVLNGAHPSRLSASRLVEVLVAPMGTFGNG
jgi:pimeloyl-ACP methyl ester carboxylesterase